MKASQRSSNTQNLINEIQLARIRVAKTEGQRKAAKEQARLARHRRKEAKEAARRAKKQAKLAKRAAAEAKQALAEAEKKLAHAVKRNAVAATRKKTKKPAASPAPKSAKPMPPEPGAYAAGFRSQPTAQMGHDFDPTAPTSPGLASDQPRTPDETAV